MIIVGSITDWKGLPVLDRDGSKIGSMEAVYFDTSTDEPVFITVKVGSSLEFVPPCRCCGIAQGGAGSR